MRFRVSELSGDPEGSVVFSSAYMFALTAAAIFVSGLLLSLMSLRALIREIRLRSGARASVVAISAALVGLGWLGMAHAVSMALQLATADV